MHTDLTKENNKKFLVKYMELGMHFSRVEKYIMESGILFAGRKPSPEYIEWFEPKEKQCYKNGQMLALEEDLQYFEGLAYDGFLPIPIEHAWNVKAGQVIDLTWELLDTKRGENHDTDCVYYGVEIPRNFMWDNMVKTEAAQQLIYKFWRLKLERERDKEIEIKPQSQNNP